MALYGSGPRIVLSGSTVVGTAPVGSTIATLAMDDGSTGWSFSLLSDPDNLFNITGPDLNTSAPLGTKPQHIIAIVASKPKQTSVIQIVAISVLFDHPALNILTLDLTTATAGTSSTIHIVGATAGSSIVGIVPDGMTLDSTARTITGAPTTAGTYTFSLVETLDVAANSPKSSTVTITVNPSSFAAPVLTLTDSSTNPPQYTRSLPGYVVGDVLQIEWNYTGTFTGTPNESHTLTSDDLVLGGFSFSTFTALSGTVYWRERGVHAGTPTAWSNTLSCVVGMSPKLVVDGDSITAWAGSAQNAFNTTYPALPFQNFAVGGSGVPALQSRADSVLAANPSVIAIQIGTNDLVTAATADDWLNGLKALVAYYKAGRPGVKVFVATLIPAGDGTSSWALFPSRRAYVNPLIIAGTGVWHDGVIPFGSHPDVGVEGAQLAGVWFQDSLHPSAIGRTALSYVFRAVMEAVFGFTSTPFSSTNVTNAVAGQDYTSDALVNGLAVNASTTATVSGSGTFSLGTGSPDTATKTAKNGEIFRRHITASATAGASLSQTLTVGTHADTWSVQTAAATAPVSIIDGPNLTASPAGLPTNYTWTAVALKKGVFVVSLKNDYNTITGISVAGGGTAHQFGPNGTWAVPIPADGNYDVTLLGANMSNCGISGIHVVNAIWPPTSTDGAAIGYVGDVNVTTAAAMNPGAGMGLTMTYAGGTEHTLGAGLTLVKDTGWGVKFSSFTTNMSPSFHASYEYAGMDAATFSS